KRVELDDGDGGYTAQDERWRAIGTEGSHAEGVAGEVGLLRECSVAEAEEDVDRATVDRRKVQGSVAVQVCHMKLLHAVTVRERILRFQAKAEVEPNDRIIPRSDHIIEAIAIEV